MKNLLSLALTGVALLAAGQPMYAKPDKERGRGRAAAVPGQVKKMAMQQPSKARVQTQRSVAMQPQRSVIMRTAPETRATFNPGKRAVVTRNSPSVAFGGQTRIDRERNRFTTSDRRRYEFETRSDFRRYHPPVAVYRDWDRDRIYSWSNHRWHWYDGAWVVIGGGYDYDVPVTTYSYSESGNLTVEVQRQLAREGYDPGPIDGVMGGQTRSAILAFQRDRGLPMTGRIDNPLLRELNI